MVADIMSFVVENKMWFIALIPLALVIVVLKILS